MRQLKGEHMEKLTGNALAAAAYKARLLAVDAVFTAASGHPGGSMSCMDALTALYFNEMNIDPKNPSDPDRDRFVLSKGHCSPALYSVLAERGFFPIEDLKLFRSIKGHYSGHPDMVNVPGVDMSTGSLGQGLSAAVGMALAAKHCGKSYRTYAILGDGELAEGQIWEAVMAAAKWKLDNLCIFVDLNGLQIDGKTADVMPTDPVDEKFRAFNWNVLCIDGHDFDAILSALADARKVSGKPTAIVMKTTKGKGISFMENQAGWHGKAPNAEQYATAKAELEAKIAELEG
jgi:transketolase